METILQKKDRNKTAEKSEETEHGSISGQFRDNALSGISKRYCSKDNDGGLWKSYLRSI